MHASIFVEEEGILISTMDPTKLALHLVVSFDKFLDKNLLTSTSTDQVLCMNINFLKLVSKYKLFKEAVTVDDSITFEKYTMIIYRSLYILGNIITTIYYLIRQNITIIKSLIIYSSGLEKITSKKCMM